MKLALLAATAVWVGAMAFPTEAATQHVWVEIRHDTVYVGERFPLIIIAEYPDDRDLILPEAEGDEPASFGDFELLRLRDRSVTSDYGQPVRDSLVFDATTFALDTAATRGAELAFAGAGDTLYVEVLDSEVMVASVVQEGEPPRELAPIVDLPAPLWPWILGGLLVLGTIVLFVWWRRRRAAVEEGVHSPASLPPIDEARVRLQKLENHPLDTPEHQRRFVIELTDIIRTYIARRLNIRAREMTSGEVLAALAQHDVTREKVADAQRILEVSDRIKFARAESSERILRESHSTAATWIEDVERQLQRHDEESNEATARA